MADPHPHPDTPLVPDTLTQSVSILSKKWHPAIIRCLSEGDGLGYSDIENTLTDISAKVLTDALTELQEHDVIDRTETSQQPLRVQYTLTERGRELEAVVQSLADWGDTHLTGEDTEHVVLVADDDTRVRAMHETWLADSYTVRTARDGKEVLNNLDTSVSAIVLDRRMPGLSGDEVLDWIRSQHYDIRVVMVTAEDPDVEILEMGFDEYLTKPVLKDELQSVMADLIARSDYDAMVREYLSLRSKVGLLEAELPADALADNDAYNRCQQRLATLDDDIDEIPQAAEKAFERAERI